MSDVRFVWDISRSQSGWRYSCPCLLLIGPVVGLLEWISMTADGVRLSMRLSRENVRLRDHKIKENDIRDIGLKRLPR